MVVPLEDSHATSLQPAVRVVVSYFPALDGILVHHWKYRYDLIVQLSNKKNSQFRKGKATFQHTFAIMQHAANVV